jgi:tetratricopeptide (TPR) repeat protein
VDEGAEPAWRALEAGMVADDDPFALFRLAGEVLRAGGGVATAELFDRAADAPHDVQRLLELGEQLLTGEQPDAAAVVLERALAAAPFDAVVRSELAIAHARAGRPERVLETLALHPCLADDPGALFQFGWASLLAGDLASAEGALSELSGAPTLRVALEHAVARATLGMATDPPDARHFLFVQHGGLLLDSAGPLGGRYGPLVVDGARLGQLLGRAATALRTLVPAPRRVVALDELHRPLAEALAQACGGSVVPLEEGRGPSAVLVLDRAERVEALGREGANAGGPLLLALTMETGRPLAKCPDVVGVFARSVELAETTLRSAEGVEPEPAPDLLAFAEPRRAWLLAQGRRSRIAYVPDAPLPR